MITGPDRWYTVGARLVTAVKAGLSAGVARWGQVPGEIVWDECNCDGALYVSAPRIYLSELFPGESEGPLTAKCQAPYEVAEFTVAVVRCAPTGDPTQGTPTAGAVDTAAHVLLRDAAETLDALAALLCGMENLDEISNYAVAPAESNGPQGDCVGVDVRVLIALERA
jgi:hypothetical protein